MLLGNIVFLLFSSSLFAIIYLEISITYREVKSGKFTIERVSLAIFFFPFIFSGLNKISDLARKIEISVQFGKMTNFLSLLVIALACIIVHAQKTSDQKREYTSKK